MDDELPNDDEPVGETELTELLAGELDDQDVVRNVINRLSTERDELRSEIGEVKGSHDEAEYELEKRESEAFDVLRAVRDWFDNVLLHKRAMTDPRKILYKVERALQQ